MKRVVITGLGIISSIGNNKEEVLNSLKNGDSGVSFSNEFKKIGLRSCVYGDIKLSQIYIKEKIKRKLLRFMSDCSIYAYLSMKEAIQDSKLTEKEISNNTSGLIVGSGGGSPRYQVFGSDCMRKRGIRSIGPYMVTKAMASGISACLATSFGVKGVSYSISSACATSAHCIGHAFELIQSNKQNIIFAGGGEEVTWELSCEFDAMGALSTKYNHTPKEASRTYDRDRDGFVISGGAGIVVLEELEHALKRKAKIYAEIVGYGVSSDGYDMVVPSGEGAVRCMKMALKKVDDKIDYINAHGTSTKIGDTKELDAIKKVFQEYIPAISSTKSMTGHSLGAAGVHEIIYTLLMLNNNFIAPSINIYNLDKKAEKMNIITKKTKKILKLAMSNSFGFGGTNASLVIKKYNI